MIVVKTLDEVIVTVEDIKRHTDADKSLCLLKNYIQSGFHAIVDCELSWIKNFELNCQS